MNGRLCLFLLVACLAVIPLNVEATEVTLSSNGGPEITVPDGVYTNCTPDGLVYNPKVSVRDPDGVHTVIISFCPVPEDDRNCDYSWHNITAIRIEGNETQGLYTATFEDLKQYPSFGEVSIMFYANDTLGNWTKYDYAIFVHVDCVPWSVSSDYYWVLLAVLIIGGVWSRRRRRCLVSS
ncbi:MAG: hypothetical protein ACFFDI_11525 [Promethearchaeota archaeon]